MKQVEEKKNVDVNNAVNEYALSIFNIHQSDRIPGHKTNLNKF